MNIGQAAQASGLSVKAIRYYEDMGLVIPSRDRNNDYRIYSSDDVERLRFLQGARAAGFGVDECSELLALYLDPARRCEQVKALVIEKICQVDLQLASMATLRETLSRMANECVFANGGGDPIGTAVKTLPQPIAMAFTLVGGPDVT